MECGIQYKIANIGYLVVVVFKYNLNGWNHVVSNIKLQTFENRDQDKIYLTQKFPPLNS